MTSVETNFYVPPDFSGDTFGIAPDSVIAACGSGTIPRVLRSLGVHMDAGDISPDHCRVTENELRRLGQGWRGPLWTLLIRPRFLDATILSTQACPLAGLCLVNHPTRRTHKGL